MSQIFRLYIDESGDHSYGKKELQNLKINRKDKFIVKQWTNYPHLDRDDKRYLGLTGCIIEVESYRSIFHPRLEGFKQKHFPHNPDDPVILHRKDIVNKQGPFWRLRAPEIEKSFNTDLLLFLKEMDYTIITVVIDKKAHIERYQDFAYHPYHYCLAAMLERYCGFLQLHNAKGDVLAESRGGTEDKQLKEAYRSIYNSGTQFRPPKFFQKVLTSKEIKLKHKSANIAGLQIADLLAHPLKQEILIENQRLSKPEEETFGKKLCEIINKEKYNRHIFNGHIQGYGKVFIK
jgi:hypothetical protein